MADINDTLRKYKSVLSLMEAGNLELMAEYAEELRRQLEVNYDSDIELTRRLLVTRLSYKQSGTLTDVEAFLKPLNTQNPLLKAEVLFVKGLHQFHAESPNAGAECFSKAADLYFLADWPERALLSLYNAFIGQLNAGLLDEKNEEAQLSYLERLSHTHENKKVLGLILRHKSSFLQNQGRLLGAEAAATQALEHIKNHGTVSDYQLSVLQLCDVLFNSGKKEKAQEHFESLLGPFEERVKFACDWVQSQIHATLLPDPNEYPVVPPLWRNKFKMKKNLAPQQDIPWTWDLSLGTLTSPERGEIALKRSSMEGRILELLSEKRRSKSELCALLWPEESESTLIWDRLSKALARVKKKTPHLITWRDGFYSLTSTIIFSDTEN